MLAKDHDSGSEADAADASDAGADMLGMKLSSTDVAHILRKDIAVDAGFSEEEDKSMSRAKN